MKKTFLVLTAACYAAALSSITALGETTIAQWSFEGVTLTNTGTTPNITGGSAASDVGSLAGESAFTGNHVSASTSWSNPSGNGSQKSISSTYWNVGDYYQFSFSTTNVSGISFAWSQMGSNTGPRDFKVQYSTDGSLFTDASGTNCTYMVTNDAWLSTSVKTASIRIIDLSTVSALDDQAIVYIRLVDNSTSSINAGTVATSGSDRIDSVTVTANSTLPIELVSFTGISRGNAVELRWKTATEVDNYGFGIERKSMNNEQSTINNWTKVAFVQGNGTSNVPHNYSYTDNVGIGKFSYRLKQIDRDCKFQYSAVVEATVGIAPHAIMLGQNYPNPFNPETSIEFAVPAAGHTTLKVYNMLGQEIATLVNGNMEAGVLNRVSFNGSNFPSGMYFYTLRSGNFVDMKKMLMIK